MMKNFVLKAPGWLIVFSMLLFPFLFILKIISSNTYHSLQVLLIIPYFVSTIWYLSVAEYMCYESKSKKYLRLIYLLGFVEVCLFMLNYFCDRSSIEVLFGSRLMYMSITLLVQLVYTLFMIIIIRRVFYARSIGFLFIEIMFPILGILTLEAEIKNHHKASEN